MKNPALLLLMPLLFPFASALAVVPVQPGVEVPPAVIEAIRERGDQSYPGGLAATMIRYAEDRRLAVQWGLDGVDDIYAHAPVLAGKYSDSGPDQWPISQMQTQLFDGPWPPYTMREYYQEISFNQFHLDGSVFGWYTSTMTQAYVTGSNYGLGSDAHVGEFIVELIQAADPSTDFGLYDNDGPDGVPNSGDDDRIVDALFVIHYGAGGETGAQNVWSHSWSLQWAYGGYYNTGDPSASGGNIAIGPYIIQPAVNSGGGMIEIGVFCHEYGHAIGLPDLYDTDYSSAGVGSWCLMGSGSWNTPSRPAHMLSWCRYKMGWIIPTDLTGTVPWLHDQAIPPIATSGQAFRMWTNGAYTTQYFMVENRRRFGSDLHLPGEGLAIWHVDEMAQQSNEIHPKVDMEEADGQDHLYHGIGSGDMGDIFPGYSNNRWFDEYTYPSSRTYYNSPSLVAVWNVSDPSDTMTANLDAVYSQPLLQFLSTGTAEITGNGDGRPDPGETVSLWFNLENLWGDADSLQLTLGTPSGWTQLIDSTSFILDLLSHGVGGNQGEPFVVAFAPEAPGGVFIPFTLQVTDGGEYHQELPCSLQIGRAPVLLVDDDQGAGYQSYLAQSISEAGVYHEVWDVSALGSPGDEILFYENLVWMTGNDSLNTLSVTDQASLIQYLDQGRTLILTGQGINEDLGGTDFFRDVLKCDPDQDDENQVLCSGVTSNWVTSGMSLLLNGVGGANNQNSPSSVSPREPASSLFSYANGHIAGVHYQDPTTQANVVYLAFGLEGIGGPPGFTTSAQVLNSLFMWAGAVAVPPAAPSAAAAPADFRLLGAHPNPFNPETAIGYRLPAPGLITLRVYDTAGRVVTTLVNGWRDAGAHEVTFDGAGLASGVYLVRLEAGDFTQTQKIVLLK
ncbi:MAG: M6 family metalloprotease domain-containing protein [Candidatus Zixiibacteriota bacterium]|nr:MAG: M6 family metalloprotease domain-containing protein [candidate division Zixibacteria bacterium]